MSGVMSLPVADSFLGALRRNPRRSGVAAAALFAGIYAVRRYRAKLRADGRESTLLEERALKEIQATSKKRIGVDKDFFKKVGRLLRIVIPGLRSKEFAILLLHTSALVFRTLLSIYVATLDGEITRNIVSGDVRSFAWNLAKWMAIAIPATYTNSMIRFLESTLALCFRTRLVDYAYTQYMKNQTYYKVGNLDTRIDCADQCMTEDISRFCAQLSHLYSQISKPILDVFLMSYQLIALGTARSGSGSTILPAIIGIGTTMATGKALRMLAPPFGRMVAYQAQLEGNLRFIHSRLITHSEEIAFYRGHEVEESILRTSYEKLRRQIMKIYRSRINYIMLEQFMMKYLWSASGLIMVAMPALTHAEKTREIESTGGLNEQAMGRTQDFVTSRSLLSSTADAIERIMSSYKEVTELAGYTERVSMMIDVFDDVDRGHYVRNQLDSADADTSYKPNQAVVERVHGGGIHLEDVPIITPTGDLLADKVNLDIEPGMHLLITGPNGCGKSSLFRMLGALWPVWGGRFRAPAVEDQFYIPQKPYLVVGSLRQQIIYPDSGEQDMKKRGMTDDDLMDIMKWVALTHVVEREGGLDAVNDWKDVLSGGEKQRIGMARLFYFKPQYALLDECTSAVSIDVEGQMYQHAKDIGITLLTITHRPTLWKFHSHILQFDGAGGYRFGLLDADSRLSLEDEKKHLESKLKDVPQLAERLRALCTDLGEDCALDLDHFPQPSTDISFRSP
eukprot:Clim_evm17s53 gene=Clim_evmTU17s53